MKMHTLAGAGATALLLGAFAAGGMTLAGAPNTGGQAAKVAGKASKALAKNDAAHAVGYAEQAVALSPRDAALRLLLGQSYLKAGRFASAERAFADTLTLSGEGGPAVGKAALNLALAQIAQGRPEQARTTLSEHAAVIPARDRGLALALAGDPNGGVALLAAAARSTDADARTRQNLGLALALAGRWADARTTVASDMTPDEANRRIVGWIDFARPRGPADQVAALLGVTPVEDGGQPAALALGGPAPAEAAPVEVAADEAVAPIEAARPAPPAEPVAQRVVFAERREVAQALPAAARTPATKPALLIAAKGPFKAPLAARVTAAPAKGSWFVQLGAFDSAGVARDAWKRATRRYVALSAHTPAGMAFKASQGAFYRLSVGGFARTDAVTLCRGIRAKGGACFVRAGAGDQVAQWVKPAKAQTAARVRVAKPHGAAVQVAAR